MRTGLSTPHVDMAGKSVSAVVFVSVSHPHKCLISIGARVCVVVKRASVRCLRVIMDQSQGSTATQRQDQSTSLTCLLLPLLTGPSNSGAPRCQTHYYYKHYICTTEVVTLIRWRIYLVFSIYYYSIF